MKHEVSPVEDSSEPLLAEPSASVDRIFADAELPNELVGKRSGRRVRLEPEPGGERLVICSAEGRVELSVRLTPQGPVLTLSGARIELDTDELALRCRQLEIDVGEAATLRARSLTTRVEADHSLEIGGRSQQRAQSLALEATLGNIELRANDDVEVEGERIWLNR